MDTLTTQLIRRIEQLPARKKAAILELLRAEPSSADARHVVLDEEAAAAWKKELLHTSVWTEEDVARIKEARAWINQWKPASL